MALLFFAGMFSVAHAQTRTITGKVTAANDGQPLPGVTILVKGTSNVGTSTDVNGTYSLDVPSDKNVLVFSYVGFVKQEITIGDQSVINVEMKQDIQQLNDVVVVGYGSQIKEDLTGNISSVSGEDIESVPVNSFERAIQGRAAGVFVNAGNGKLGQAIQVSIRGASSLSAGNQPLYVVDGVPVSSQSLSSTGYSETNPMASLDMSDIESISVLKDASAAAIYGSRASNGVVIITTKSGQTGDTKFNVQYQVSSSSPSGKRDFLNAQQYVDFFRQATIGGAKYDYKLYPGYYTDQQAAINWWMDNIYTTTMNSMTEGNDWQNNPTDYNWQDQAFQSGASQSFKLSASGGNENTTFFAGGGFSDEQGILIGNAYKKLNGRLNLDHQATDKLKFGLKININRTLNDRLSDDDQFSTPMQLVAQAPVAPFFADADGDPTNGYQKGDVYNTNTYYYNGLDINENSTFRTRTFHILSNANAEYNILPNLSFKTKFGMDLINQNEEQYYKPRLAYYVGANGYGYNAWTEVQNYTSDNILTYENTFADKHNLNVVLGTSYNWVMQSFTSVEGENFPNQSFHNIDNAADITSGDVTDTNYRFMSYFMRANYKYNDRYLLTLSARTDGSSRFGANNRYGFFPAASVGWILTEEDFMQDLDAISFLKLRASYGVTGNADINNFPSLGLYSGISYAGAPATAPSQTANPDLKWETTNQLDVGIDFGFLDNRINGEIDYYRKKTTDLLLNVNVPGTSGFSSQLRNVGKLQNEGFEFVINSVNTTGKFFWSSRFNMAFNRNKVTDLGGQILEGGFVNRAVEGEAIGVFYTYEFAGVNPDNGDALFFLNHDPTNAELNSGDAFKVNGMFDNRYVTNSSNVASRTVVGNPNPDFVGGFNNTFSYKGVSLDMFWQFVYGNQIYNGGWYMSASGLYFDNQTTDQLNAWQEPGDITNVPEARLYYDNGASTSSSRYLSDGSYLRLKTLTLSYDLPQNLLSKLNLRKAKVFVTGTNLVTITNYDGWDPEVNTDWLNSNLALGNDFYASPQPRTFSVGVNFGF
ncbi:MAG: TonB-dependent receptor [Balneolaceae bacterium]|jgi:TonB-linked SusC/RagA family outer membrane protein